MAASLARGPMPRAGRAAGRRQDHARAAGAARRALGRGPQDHRAGAAPARRPRGGGPHGAHAWRSGRRDRRPARATRLEDRPADPHRGGHRGRLRPHDPRRSRNSTASPPCCSTSSTSARSTPISASRWPSTRRAALREDLRILVMSATLDGARVAALLGDAPVIESEGRAFPVETRYLGRDPRRRIEDEVADAVLRALAGRAGSILVFLPGQGEIRRVETRCASGSRDPGGRYRAALRRAGPRAQDLAVEPAKPGRRKVVLATSIAETSLTIEGVRVVIDCGLARVPRYEPAHRPDAAGDRARLPRRRRPAARPRRPHRAGRLLPALGGGRHRRAANPSPSRRSCRPISPASCSTAPPGA